MAKTLTFSQFSKNTENNPHSIPIVLLHGWGVNSAVWQPLLALFSKNNNATFQLITIDLPGFGDNHAIDVEPYDLDNICLHLNNTITHPAIYLGWSLGGLLATQMSINHPEKVLGVISVASSPYFIEHAEQDWPGIKPHVLNNFHQQLSENTEQTIKGFLKIQAMGSPHIRHDLKLITQLVMERSLPSQHTLNKSLRLLSDCDLRQHLTKISQPFLRLYGKNDGLVPKSAIEKINALSPQSDIHIFTHASHAPFISHPDDFYDVLTNWLLTTFTSNR